MVARPLTCWIDAQLPPSLAPWLTATFGVEAYSVAYLGYREAEDEVIFPAARTAGAVVSKDADFLERLVRLGPPPQLLYLTCGNTSKARLVEILNRNFEQAHQMLLSGEPVVEITS